MINPKVNPPICAHQAIPLSPPPWMANKPEYNCDTNQKIK
jgi:hypothetical protein